MAYDNEMNQEYIKSRMLDKITNDIDKREGSFMYDAISPTANEVSQLYMQLDLLRQVMFLEESYGEYLDLRAQEFSISRKEGTYASGQLVISVTQAMTLPKGTIFRTNGGLEYKVESATPLSGTSTINLIATTKGSAYNIPADSITSMAIPMPGIESFTNNAFTGGTDEETDEELKARIAQRMSNPPGSGSKADYVRWSKEIDGVDFVKVIPLYNGPGSVKIVVGGSNGSILDSTKITEVQNYIDPVSGQGEGFAPIGSEVLVVTLQQLLIDISISGLSVSEGYQIDSVQTSINNNITTNVNALEPGSELKYKNVLSWIINTDGVDDFTDLTINSGNANISVTDEEKIVLNAINYI